METFFVSQEYPVNALALNRSNTQVAIGGRNVFKVYAIEGNKFREVCNLRASKHLNLNFSCNDVAWSSLDDHYLATAATNGHVCVWNLTKMGKAMQEQDYQDHKRTVNKVNFHYSESNKLISGSQDGTMRYFDLRAKSAVSIFYSNTESVRDVQFSPHNPYSFAAVSDNGSVQLWDLRRTEKYQQQFTAHSGPVFACDWHPETLWLATASRDKTIKVWDLTPAKPTLEYTIHTIASIGHVKWRPQRKFHIASCALVIDCGINIWDVRRPYIPFATFNEHRDIPSGVAWKGSPHVFMSCGRDCALYHHVFNDATRPASKANPQAVCLGTKGEVFFARKVAVVTTTPVINNNPIAKATALMRKISNTQTVDQFHQAASTLYHFSPINEIQDHDFSTFYGLASNYLLHGRSISELCEHNSAVAREFGQSHISVTWKIVKTLFGEEFMQNYTSPHDNSNTDNDNGNKEDTPSQNEVSENDENPASNPAPDTVPDSEQTSKGNLSSPTEENTPAGQLSGGDDETENEDQVDHADSLIHNGYLYYLNMSAGLPKGDFSFGENELDMELDSMDPDFRHGIRSYPEIVPVQQDWTLPNEAFPLKHEILDKSPPPEHWNHYSPDINYEPHFATVQVEEQPLRLLTVTKPLKKVLWDPSTIVVQALKHHATLGDIQSAACMLMVLGDNRKYLKLNESIQEQWLLGYIELLSRYKLWNLSTEFIKLTWLPSVYQLNQQSTTYHTSCSKCMKPLQRVGWLCDRCHSTECAKCSICHQVVKGLYAWCQGCAHGGHLVHMQEWMALYKFCPTGCGHICEYR